MITQIFQNKNCRSLTNLPLDDLVFLPLGKLNFSDFYGKKLNIVVDYYSVAENREDVTNEAINGRYIQICQSKCEG